MSIEFDPAKARSNLRKHGVSFAHSEQVLRDPAAVTIEDPDAAGEQRLLTLGGLTLWGGSWWWFIHRAVSARA